MGVIVQKNSKVFYIVYGMPRHGKTTFTNSFDNYFNCYYTEKSPAIPIERKYNPELAISCVAVSIDFLFMEYLAKFSIQTPSPVNIGYEMTLREGYDNIKFFNFFKEKIESIGCDTIVLEGFWLLLCFQDVLNYLGSLGRVKSLFLFNKNVFYKGTLVDSDKKEVSDYYNEILEKIIKD